MVKQKGCFLSRYLRIVLSATILISSVGLALAEEESEIQLLFEIKSDKIKSFVGNSVTIDIDGDLKPEMFVTYPHYDQGTLEKVGKVVVYSGASMPPATEIASMVGGSASEYFGSRMVKVGDISGDGVPDIAVSAPGFNVNRGKVLILDSVSLTPICEFRSLSNPQVDDSFGEALALLDGNLLAV
ncbi:MAG: VCBS repeat-containing protein, partial [Bdellovibrionales bacterium]|nr:VCBS repeat-containing protein [Bdellovibrionales bacterium]